MTDPGKSILRNLLGWHMTIKELQGLTDGHPKRLLASLSKLGRCFLNFGLAGFPEVFFLKSGVIPVWFSFPKLLSRLV